MLYQLSYARFNIFRKNSFIA